MKYLRQENNRFIFEDGKELQRFADMSPWFAYKDMYISTDLEIDLQDWVYDYSVIQTAVQMMTILKEKGLV